MDNSPGKINFNIIPDIQQALHHNSNADYNMNQNWLIVHSCCCQKSIGNNYLAVWLNINLKYFFFYYLIHVLLI